MTLFRVLILTALLAIAPCVGQAQTATGNGALTVQRGLSISTVRPMRLEPVSEDPGLSLTASNLVDAPAMIQVSGDPGRVYRIRLPQAGGEDSVAVIEDLRIWSANAGDISEARVARLDVNGRDLLRVSGQLRLRVGAEAEPIAALPLSIDYE